MRRPVANLFVITNLAGDQQGIFVELVNVKTITLEEEASLVIDIAVALEDCAQNPIGCKLKQVNNLMANPMLNYNIQTGTTKPNI